MPDLPQFDFEGLAEFFSLMLVAFGVIWGLNKAVIIAKQG